MNADGPCPVCGTGFRLPSGQCDHCDAASPWSKIPALREYDKLADAISSYVPMTGLEMPADRAGDPRFALGMITGALALAQAQSAHLQADNAKLREESRRLELERDQFKAWYETQTVRIDNAQADNAKKREDVERITSGYHRRADELDAQYRELISLRTQLQDITNQFFAVSQEGAKLREVVSSLLGATRLWRDSDPKGTEHFLPSIQARADAALQSSRAAEEKP